jgi:hypothetical protein
MHEGMEHGAWGIGLMHYALFPDAEFAEDVAEDFFIGDFTCDCAQVVKCLFDINGNQIGGDVILESFAY